MPGVLRHVWELRHVGELRHVRWFKFDIGLGMSGIQAYLGAKACQRVQT